MAGETPPHRPARQLRHQEDQSRYPWVRPAMNSFRREAGADQRAMKAYRYSFPYCSPALVAVTGLAGVRRFGLVGAWGWGLGLARDLAGGGVGAWGVALFVWRVGLVSGFWFFYIYVSSFLGCWCWSDGVTVCISPGQSLYLTGLAPLY